ncbi:ThuA domain-containing protein [uncultured Cyclobacterium sp.]|uniref:ThuA domain-containing protein n=1 Tax=uncultured Cyclobacterium sp. TaxID=453820 RepID=UPI0030EB3C92|tara:strand:+ start:38931 stop:40505 length:1575 start_codon:yes stop_codon:yes gene_type:complete
MHKLISFLLLFFICFFSVLQPAESSELAPMATTKKIVLIAGPKSHGPKAHEYIKSVRLIKTMLDNSNVEEIATEIHFNGWPEDPLTLEDAALILFISDGRDGPLYDEVPFMTIDRMKVMKRQMDRGCGLSLIHFSTFASDEMGKKVLDWGGGYFDWQDDQGERNWYSAIKTMETELAFPDTDHTILSGVQPFRLKDEYYYNIRFQDHDNRLKRIAEVPALGGREGNSNTVAWAVDRLDGGRGFSTTMGHFFSNWENANYRKMVLNGIVWAAGADVPKDGVEAKYYEDEEVTQHLYQKSGKVLLLTGNHHPAHPWKETSPLIKSAIEGNSDFFVDISTNIEDLYQYDLDDYDALILNYANWEDPKGLSDASKDSFVNYLKQGGGLMVLHFANGAFHSSLPNAGKSDWPEYREIVRRIWDHDADSGHDKYGEFSIHISNSRHPITSGIKDFSTFDELYFNQKGELPIAPLFSARSTVTGKDEPLAWVYNYGEGRVFQTLLGHDAKSFSAPEFQQILSNAIKWVAKK